MCELAYKIIYFIKLLPLSWKKNLPKLSDNGIRFTNLGKWNLQKTKPRNPFHAHIKLGITLTIFNLKLLTKNNS